MGVDDLIVSHNVLKAPKGARPIAATESYRKFKAKKILIDKNIQSED